MKIKRTLDTLRSVAGYPGIVRSLQKARSSIFFIFPSWQIGGSERVHADIMKAVRECKPVCIITSVQEGDGFRQLFEKYANVIYLRRWGSKVSFRPKMAKLVAKAINRQDNVTVFGSNNLFFYDVIPYLKEHVRIIDLTHSITPNRDWCEAYSVPYVERIQHRVVLGTGTLEAFKEIYAQHGISKTFLERFRVIPNKVSVTEADSDKQDRNGPFEVLFVGRNSDEKRPVLFFEIAKRCTAAGIDASFTAVGDFDTFAPRYASYVNFVGQIRDESRLKQYYRKSHLILITSVFEGFPMVLLESMVFGVVPVCTAVGEIPNYISEQRGTGYVVDKQSSEEQLVERFVEIIKELSRNRALWKTYSERCVEMVKQNFNEQQFAHGYRSLLIND